MEDAGAVAVEGSPAVGVVVLALFEWFGVASLHVFVRVVAHLRVLSAERVVAGFAGGPEGFGEGSELVFRPFGPPHIDESEVKDDQAGAFVQDCP